MASKKQHPYLTREFWKTNTFWRNGSHGKHEVYEEIYKNIMDSFIFKEDNISTNFKKNN